MTMDITAASAQSADISRDEVYFFDLITFKVENCLFKVPKHKFQEQSHVFQDMFTLPSRDDDAEVEGASDENPILLDGVQENTFRLLLSLLYPLGFKTTAASSLSLDDCSSLLDLSRMWGFDQICDYTTARIRDFWWNSIGPVQKVELAHKYDIQEWRMPAYEELAMRSEPLTVSEALRLGADFTAKMAQVREKRLVMMIEDRERWLSTKPKTKRKQYGRVDLSSDNDTGARTQRAISDVFGV